MPSDLSPLWISLKTAALATTITFGLGIAAAYWMLGYRGRGKSLIEGLFLLPLILPPTVAGFVLLLLLGKNGPLGALNFNLVFTWYGAVIAATVVAFPLMYKTALGAFEQIDPNLLHVARTLGASEWKVFWQIVLPLSRPGVLAGVTLAFARALGEFGATLMLAGNIPGQTQTIPMAIYFAVEAGEIQEAWFWAIAIMSLSLSALVLVNHRPQRGKSSRKHRNSKTSPAPSQISSERQPVLLKVDPQVPRLQTQPVNEPPQLIVDIQTQRSDFLLKISLSVPQQTLGILGASGAGKSMLLRCIAGVETPTRGKIVLNGRVLFDSALGINLPSRDRHLGLLVQNYALFPHLTVAQNIAFGLPNGCDRAITRQQVSAQLAAVQLLNLENCYPQELSGGQQQRVALARALASQPEALLLDEPFSALDTYLRSQLEQKMMTRLATYPGVTLWVTHNLEEVYRLGQTLLVIERGQAIAYGAKQVIFERPASFRVAQLTGCKNFSRAIARSDHHVEAMDWGCTLHLTEPVPDQIAFIGIRAHQIRFTDDPNPLNTFPCWLVATSETPHRMTLYLTLHQPPNHSYYSPLQAEVLKETWLTLKQQPSPWLIRLDSDRLMPMTH